MRIIGGEWGGRRIHAPAAGARPTADRVRQTLFDILGSTIVDHAVLDLYAGSGAIGLEALSRGASSAIFVEASRSIRLVLERNLRETGAEGRSRVLGLPVQRALGVLRSEGHRFSFIFADPPYGDPGTLELLTALGPPGATWLAAEGCLILETRIDFALAEQVGLLRRRRIHRVGDTVLHFFVRGETEGG